MSADIIDLDDHRGPWINRAMTCSACGKTFICTSPVDMILPCECPACGKMEGMPVEVLVKLKTYEVFRNTMMENPPPSA